MTLEFDETIFGIKKETSIRKDVTCHTCHGDGAKPGTSKKTCSYCHGSEHVSVEQNTILGRVRTEQTRPRCEGSSQEFEEPCPTCYGKRTENRTVRLGVTVPEGVDNEQQIRLAGEGASGESGGPHGDLYVVFRVKPSDKFRRDGDDLFYELNTSLSQASPGDEVKVPTLNSNAMFTVPVGIQNGKQFRLKEKGVKNVHGYGHDDLSVSIKVVIPNKLTDRQKELMREFAEASGENLEEQPANFKDKARKPFRGE